MLQIIKRYSKLQVKIIMIRHWKCRCRHLHGALKCQGLLTAHWRYVAIESFHWHTVALSLRFCALQRLPPFGWLRCASHVLTTKWNGSETKPWNPSISQLSPHHQQLVLEPTPATCCGAWLSSETSGKRPWTLSNNRKQMMPSGLGYFSHSPIQQLQNSPLVCEDVVLDRVVGITSARVVWSHQLHLVTAKQSGLDAGACSRDRLSSVCLATSSDCCPAQCP